MTWTPLLSRDRTLAKRLGGAVRCIMSATGRKRYFAQRDVVSTVGACREVARANKVVAFALAARVKRHVAAVARAYDVLDYGFSDGGPSRSLVTHDEPPLSAATRLAKLFAVPWVLGPLRVLPSGAFEITLGAEWLPATEDLLRALDAEARLGARVKVVNIAVETLLARMKEGTP